MNTLHTPNIVDILHKETSFIWITFEFEGIHCYPNAPDEVAFLRDPHRHIFKVKIQLEVFHDDREIEFILFKRFIKDNMKSEDCNYMSCENLCDYFNELIITKYEGYSQPEKHIYGRKMIIDVSEDGENGATKIYEPFYQSGVIQ